MTTNNEVLDPITVAVDALTAAARTTRVMGKGTTREQTIRLFAVEGVVEGRRLVRG